VVKKFFVHFVQHTIGNCPIILSELTATHHHGAKLAAYLLNFGRK
jgi:hypothetical protein